MASLAVEQGTSAEGGRIGRAEGNQGGEVALEKVTRCDARETVLGAAIDHAVLKYRGCADVGAGG